ncbi:protein NCBP2AS2 homolog [Athalia rosae]|uniref:protein NCBP2AS2 homolog n=1 Tax=Athalia rosae TaxID=37344 RepID=UPI000DE7F685|nr:protein NCBP2AS2 homolog [Athalia rosae]
MVLRFLMRYLANNEQVVNKLADSKPIRRAAQFVVYLINRSSISGVPTSPTELGKQWKNLLGRFASNLKEEITDAKEELKKKKFK